MRNRNVVLSAAGLADPPIYVEDVFSTYLYTGTGATQTITNNIDLSTKGGLVWTKNRSLGNPADTHVLVDTARGAGALLDTTSTNASNAGNTTDFPSFTTSGYNIGPVSGTFGLNRLSSNFVSWTFRKQQKFFDIVTYTGNGVNGRQISHNLGSIPGMIIVKSTSLSTENWPVYHRSVGGTKHLFLNNTDYANLSSAAWNNTNPTSSVFTVGSNDMVNKNGATYVAYLFAHDAGGFGASGTDSVVLCGSFTADGSGNATVNLGWEPQFVIFKSATSLYGWAMLDTMRGWINGSNDQYLRVDTSDAEASYGFGNPTSTGFTLENLTSSQTFIYMAIRRGPMKVPTSSTDVFGVSYDTGGGYATSTSLGAANYNRPDLCISKGNKTISDDWQFTDRLRGINASFATFAIGQTTSNPWLTSNYTGAESTTGNRVGLSGINAGVNVLSSTAGGQGAYGLFFRRAPGFFDIVAYTGTGIARTVNHSLGVTPEMMIMKSRSSNDYWFVYSQSLGNTKYIRLHDAVAASTYSDAWNNTSPTSSVFTVGTDAGLNGSGATNIAYLFASCPGVSKVGSYTGTGTTKQVDCGFTNGARFVLIKRTDSTGYWHVWDSARGIIAGNDPYLLLNAPDAETTNTDYIDPYSAGFEISSSAPAAINATGGTYIYLAIA